MNKKKALTRQQLGERLCQWHDSMSDHIYAVGSFYLGGHKYPEQKIVQSAINKINKLIDQNKKMIAGEKVTASIMFGTQITNDLKQFAGYNNKELKENIKDLKEISNGLLEFLKNDYVK
jgi:phosphoenolpyruvate-protein kinase (PTS system EI component)